MMEQQFLSSPAGSSNQDGEGNSAASTIKFQVCRNCRHKKRKCSLERPSCSICRERGLICEYLFLKKKPGPAKGLVVPKTAVHGNPAGDRETITVNTYARNQLIDLYFTHIQPTFPLFCRKVFDLDLAEKRIPDKLLNAMFAASVRFVPALQISTLLGWTSISPWEQFAQLAEQQSRDQEQRNAPISLNDIKTVILLTLYEYTNFPGCKAWLMAGKMIRLSMSLGLHRVDVIAQNPKLSDLEMEEFRFVWWTAWNLETAINTLASSPFAVDSQDIGTALPSTSVAGFTAGNVQRSRLNLLPTDAARIWKSALQVLTADASEGMNMHLLVISHVRAVTTCRQRLFVNPSADLANHLMILRNAFPCLQLSLPAYFFNATIIPEEIPQQHRFRLQTLLLFYMSRIQAFLPLANSYVDDLGRDEGLRDWETCVNTCEKIGAIFKHWKPEYFAVADPMIGSLIWFTSCIMTIHTMSVHGQCEEGPDIRILNALDLLGIALENLAQHWRLCRRLSDSLKSLQNWNWLKIDFPEILSILTQLRILIDPLKAEPGVVDMWQIVGQVPAEVEATSMFENQVALTVSE